MTIEIKVPDLPESVADATIATWHKKPGDLVARDEVLVDIETDKVVLEVPAPEAGVLGDILQSEGATVLSRQLIAIHRRRQADRYRQGWSRHQGRRGSLHQGWQQACRRPGCRCSPGCTGRSAGRSH
nr:biotin/lipoyl-containing protein [Aeromonas hydrophila]